MLVMVVACFTSQALPAENVDPNGDGSQYVYSENAGWLNAEPLGDGGSGVLVTDFELTGWMWGENVGWVSFSCENDQSCSIVDYGVRHGGDGVLEGFAWGESAGWINVAPTGAGVTIDPATGVFAGRAWAENLGWISFSSGGPNPFELKTSWTCSPLPSAPGIVTGLTAVKSNGDIVVSWSGTSGASAYDVTRGDLRQLVATGDFGSATEACEVDAQDGLQIEVSLATPSGEGEWFLVRGLNCGGAGTFDASGSSQIASRDAGVSASGAGCD